MAKYLPDSTYDLALAQIENADEEAVCSVEPSSYYQACWPSMWVATTAYSVGDIVRPPTDNDFVYECTVGGTSGGSEPAWETTQDNTFSDNDITWKAHENYSLAYTTLAGGDKTIQAKGGGGREIVFAEKTGITSHRSGTVTHTAFMTSSTKAIEMITTASTTTVGDNDIVSGRTTIFQSVTAGISIA